MTVIHSVVVKIPKSQGAKRLVGKRVITIIGMTEALAQIKDTL